MHTHDNDALARKRHSLAHLLAIALLERDTEAKLTIGPAIDTGFYYDVEFTKGKAPAPEDFPTLTARMRDLIAPGFSFTGRTVSEADARAQFAGNPFKLELIDGIVARGEEISIYDTLDASGNVLLSDLCGGGHVDSASEIDPESFVIDRVAGAYWRGDETKPMLTRVYGLAFDSKAELEAYAVQQEEAKKRDHRKLGKDMDLFVFSDVVGKGLPLWTERGATIRRELERFIVDEEIRRGYHHVYTPDIAKLDLYKKSGHYPYYKDSMYSPIVIDEEEYMLRPMACPHHFELYLSSPRSYRDLPMRIAEMAKLYRYEQSGELSGLVRVRGFCLADAHIICKDAEQAGSEVEKALDLIEFVSSTFGLKAGEDYWYRLSLGDRANEEKYFKDDVAWDKAENELRTVLQKRSTKFIEVPAEAAFYGPKIDVQMRDVRGKDNTAFTVQYDFVMPKRFELSYIDSDGISKEALVIHRSSIGAIERVMAFLIEHFAGAFPLWLSPVQARIIPVKDTHLEYATGVVDKLKAAGIRAEVDNSNDSFGKRIRNAKTEKVPYLIVIGDAEMSAGTVTLEHRDLGKIGTPSVDDAVARLVMESSTRALAPKPIEA